MAPPTHSARLLPPTKGVSLPEFRPQVRFTSQRIWEAICKLRNSTLTFRIQTPGKINMKWGSFYILRNNTFTFIFLNPRLDSQAPKVSISQKSQVYQLLFDPKKDSYAKMGRFLQCCEWYFDIQNSNPRLIHMRQKLRSLRNRVFRKLLFDPK